ncbi:hypothetical protein ACFQ1L_16285 [Phytohabitans flavus]|uniref:hypothetical protein n=1 Tax=Phytohabitans flavus TaxID=1076124 RepID=UPI0015645E28|nr:hypothetical protein [Phytohabitans flavus]
MIATRSPPRSSWLHGIAAALPVFRWQGRGHLVTTFRQIRMLAGRGSQALRGVQGTGEIASIQRRPHIS